jgi:hypothetical protein
LPETGSGAAAEIGTKEIDGTADKNRSGNPGRAGKICFAGRVVREWVDFFGALRIFSGESGAGGGRIFFAARAVQEWVDFFGALRIFSGESGAGGDGFWLVVRVAWEWVDLFGALRMFQEQSIHAIDIGLVSASKKGERGEAWVIGGIG